MSDPQPLTEAELDDLDALATFSCVTVLHMRQFCDAALPVLPRLLAAAREVIRLRDLSFDGAECYTVGDVRAVLDKVQAERVAMAAEVATLRAKIAQHNVWHRENQADAARLAEELERVKGRLAHAVEFRAVGPQLCDVQFDDESEDRHEWTVWSAPGRRTNYPTLDAAWSAAEAHAAAQAAERKGGV